MLSYRHAFHAGNYADVLKHLVLIKTLNYLLKKDSPILYIDTHAGAGLYQTNSAESKKTGEFAEGFAQLDFTQLPEDTLPYHKLVQKFSRQGQYPGSPMIAMQLLRPQDQLRFFELHPADFALLQQNSKTHKRAKAEHSDGFQSLKALLPVQNQRALVLIDPSYEIKDDYDHVVKSVISAYQRMPNATFLIWYPVVNRHLIADMIRKLSKSPIKDVWQFELGLSPDDNLNHGMTSSGIFAINPPWTLASELQVCLPVIQQQIAKKQGIHLVQRLIDE
ncbi:Ribosomal RNA large subunit methyltransferase J [Thalassocella blandensis]|nr:Ribosomal RNA large subunit methyltransferase J [Thalassocella blandensis]